MKTIFFDIDGTLAQFHDTEHRYIEAMWEQGFYKNLKPFENLVAAANFLNKCDGVNVAIISAYLDTEPPFVQKEKMEWLHKYLPDVKDIRLVPAGSSKADYISPGETDIWLVDDYNKNLIEWENSGYQAIKFVNDINDQGRGAYGGEAGKLWEGKRVRFDSSPSEIVKSIAEALNLDLEINIDEIQNKRQVTQNDKFALTDESIVLDNKTKVYRIIALKDFADVRKGDLGGFVESESNLLMRGNCWIYDNAVVCGTSLVADNAAIRDNARVEGNAFVCGNTEVLGHSSVCDEALVSDNAIVRDSALVAGYATVGGGATITDSARVVECGAVSGQAIIADNASVYNRAHVGDQVTAIGNAKLGGNIRYEGKCTIGNRSNVKDKLQTLKNSNHINTYKPIGRNDYTR